MSIILYEIFWLSGYFPLLCTKREKCLITDHSASLWEKSMLSSHNGRISPLNSSGLERTISSTNQETVTLLCLWDAKPLNSSNTDRGFPNFPEERWAVAFHNNTINGWNNVGPLNLPVDYGIHYLPTNQMAVCTKQNRTPLWERLTALPLCSIFNSKLPSAAGTWGSWPLRRERAPPLPLLLSHSTIYPVLLSLDSPVTTDAAPARLRCDEH